MIGEDVHWGWGLALGVLVLAGVAVLILWLTGGLQEGMAILPSGYGYWHRSYYPYYNSLPFWWRIRYGYFSPRKFFWQVPTYYRGRPF